MLLIVRFFPFGEGTRELQRKTWAEHFGMTAQRGASIEKEPEARKEDKVRKGDDRDTSLPATLDVLLPRHTNRPRERVGLGRILVRRQNGALLEIAIVVRDGAAFTRRRGGDLVDEGVQLAGVRVIVVKLSPAG